MQKLKMIIKILKITGVYKVATGFIFFFFLSALIFRFIEPDVKTYQDGIWYCFSVFSSAGFGDICAKTLVGRLLSIALGLYSILIIGLIPGIVTSLYFEVLKIKLNQSLLLIINKLEDLPNLNKDELKEISEKIKNIKL